MNELDSYIVEFLLNTIHGKVSFGRRLYCNGIIPLTPQKNDKVQEVSRIPKLVASGVEKSLSKDNGTSDTLALDSVENLVRRHSLSLKDRTPPKESLAAGLLNSPQFNLQKTSSLIAEVKNMTERLSDFGSCVSSTDEVSDDNEFQSNSCTTLNEKKRLKKSKRKNRESPDKNQFLKKPNLTTSI